MVDLAGGRVAERLRCANDGAGGVCEMERGMTERKPSRNAAKQADIAKCAAIWREEQSKAIDRADVVRAAFAEQCAKRFERFLGTLDCVTAQSAG